MKATLILENGSIFEGQSIGSTEDCVCEMVFNTSMVGYQEILTDPSYAGQGIVMSYPLIGNYGVNSEDNESSRPWGEAFVVRHLSRRGSNFRCEGDLDDYLKEHGITGIQGVDTRAITRILRSQGTMNGMITTKMPENMEEALAKIKDYSVRGVVDKVTTKEIVSYRPGDLNTDSNVSVSKKVAILDVGTKFNIARCLLKRGCEVTIFPARTNPEDILAINPDGIMLTNGPGDPKECTEVIQNLKSLYQSDVPIFAICLGHQLMALATGCDTEKMKYGHRGANHPVKDLETGRVYISSQNHGYMVKEDSVPSDIAEVAFINVNDKTVEGLKYKNKNIFTVQFHPEACAGPKDSEVLFDRFIKMMEER